MTDLWELDNFGNLTTAEVTALGITDTDGDGINDRDEFLAGTNPNVNETALNIARQAYLKASNTGAGDDFGSSVAVSGDTVVVGAPGEKSGRSGVNSTPGGLAVNAGAAYVFVRSGTSWSQQAYLKASNTGWQDRFGESVAVSGDTVVVGAHEEDSSTTGVNSTPNESASRSGAAYVFTRGGTTWSQQAYIKASNTGVDDVFGFSVAVSGDTVVVGARLEDSSTTGVNSTPNENAPGSGATYIFTGLGPEVPGIALKVAGSDIPTGSTLAFGSVVPGEFLERVFTIQNTGSAALTLSGSPMVAISGSPDFTVTAQPVSPTRAPGSSTPFTVRFTPTGSGAKSATLTIASNDADENPFVIHLTGSATTASTLFAAAISSGSNLFGNNALPNATPYNDGVANLLKYAFNMKLDVPDVSTLTPGTGTGGLPAITIPDGAPAGTLRFEFLRRKGSGLVYTPQKSTTLDGAGWSPLTATPVVTTINDQWERVVYTEAPDPVPAPACFGRVQVAIP